MATTGATEADIGALDPTLLLQALTAVKKGDFSVRLPVDQIGLAGKIYDTFNDVVELNQRLAAEIGDVSNSVGKEGKFTQRASTDGMIGEWAAAVDSVNELINDFVQPATETARVIAAVANGDLSQRISLDVDGRPLEGEFLQNSNSVNSMVAQLGVFASEVTRVVREAGAEGKLGGQAHVPGAGGTWKELADNVNYMASNLTNQVRNIAEVAIAVANGDLSKKITVDVRGELLQLKETINAMVDQLRSFASEVTRVVREVGTEGRLGGQANVPAATGTWRDLTDGVNMMDSNLTRQLRNIAEVATGVAKGDLSKKITVEARGEIMQLKETINTMVAQLGVFASEVTRVVREAGAEGKLGGQAQVPGVAGTWKDLTDNVNFMASNLTSQVRGIAKVVTAVANGNLKQKLAVEARGEIAALSDTINDMIDTLATFAEQVTTVAREVGTEGRLGGQASVPGAAGTWRALTDNVNRLAANLTTAVRAISEVAVAVTQGDLTRSITVEVSGELAQLKDTTNQMIHNLRDTTRTNQEQDWLKTNLARFTRLLQGQRDLRAVAELILSELAPVVHVQHGVFYLKEVVAGEPVFRLFASYGYKERKHISSEFRLREGLVGECAYEKQRILLTEVPGDYIRIVSGLGEAPPLNIVLLPVLFEREVLGVIEAASFTRFSSIELSFLDQLTESIGIVFNSIASSMRTEELLKQSQSLASELTARQQELKETNERLEQQARTLQESEGRLKEQQEELQQANEELEEKAEALEKQNLEVQRKNEEIERARREVEDKAEQLAITSKYKSQFLANMSHELRTPLNSMFVLAQMLEENPEGNLTQKQVEYARTVREAGKDLLNLINQILDLSKIESGTVEVDIIPVTFDRLAEYAERTFRTVAQEKELDFTIDLAPDLPDTIYTDERRLEQVIGNLLSNALKFTEKGRVELRIEVATGGWGSDREILNRAGQVIAFVVTDTGIGIPEDKHKVIFEAFQQVEATTTRRYGGVGLGLAISREIADLLGGELRLVRSKPGEGSTFALYLPQRYVGSAGKPPAPAPPPLEAAAPSAEVKPPAAAEVPPPAPGAVADDRTAIQPGDRVALIIEGDVKSARMLLEVAHEKGFKGVVASTGEEALALAGQLKPAAITLETELPDWNGFLVLDRFKHEPETRHIPIYVISAAEDGHRSLELGARAYLQKPATRKALDELFDDAQRFIEHRPRGLLIAAGDETWRKDIVELAGDTEVRTTAVGTGEEALAALKAQQFDCMVLDLQLADMASLELINKIREEVQITAPPIIVYKEGWMSGPERVELQEAAGLLVAKDVGTPEHLLAQTTLYLHQAVPSLPEAKRRMLEQARRMDPALVGKKVLIIDDDIRNIYALTGLLEGRKMEVVYSENGRDGIERLQKTPGIDVVLMDIMMPEMDGYEATRIIRTMPKFESLPIIALTAKAMKGDREKSLAAGASDYVAKPVDNEQLLSLLRVWLHR